MAILIFIIILAVLILVHEFGHFSVAKKADISVKEFGIGFPPTIWKKKYGETTYSINAVPFGGFVKILGEDSEEDIPVEEKMKSFPQKSKWTQVAVLGAGVVFNIIFAWMLVSIGYMSGLPTPVSDAKANVVNPHLEITLVQNDSPAQKAGIKAGDVISSASSGGDVLQDLSPESFSDFVNSHGTDKITIDYTRGRSSGEITVSPDSGVVEGRRAIGIALDTIGIQRLSFFRAIWEGAKTVVNLIQAIAIGLAQFAWHAIRGHADVSQVTGPVGIIGLVGDVSQLGFIYLLSFTAFISVNLAVINLLPFPALDGGRILFVLIEAVKGSPIKPKVAQTLNTIGFALLILLMIVVTIHDIVKLV